MTIPPHEDPFGGAEIFAIDVSHDEFVAGVDKLLVLPGGQPITVRVPPGLAPNTVLRLVGPDLSDPLATKDIFVRVVVATAAGQQSDTEPALTVAVMPAVAPARRPRGKGWLAATAVAVVVVAAAAVGAIAYPRDDNADVSLSANATPSTTPAVFATPTGPPLTPAAYKAVLATVETTMTKAMQTIDAAHDSLAVEVSIGSFVSAALDGEIALQKTNPPPTFASAHRQAVSAFSSLAALAQQLINRYQFSGTCLGSGVVPDIANSPAAAAVRAAAQALATADSANPLAVGAWLPAAGPAPTRSLANGTYVKKGTRNGSGVLKIDNKGNDTDALISLALAGSKTSVFSVYVKAGGSFTVSGVQANTYDVYVIEGIDWDARAAGFTRDCSSSKYNTPFAFTTTRSTYTQWDIKLYGGTDATDPTSYVAPGDIPA